MIIFHGRNFYLLKLKLYMLRCYLKAVAIGGKKLCNELHGYIIFSSIERCEKNVNMLIVKDYFKSSFQVLS